MRKRNLIIALTVLALITACKIATAGAPCSGVTPVTFAAFDSEVQMLAKIRNALTTYTSQRAKYYSNERQRYEICFQTGGAYLLQPRVAGAANAFQLTMDAGTTDDVYVQDLNIFKDGLLDLKIPLLTITNNGAGKVILQNATITHVKDGLALKGSGSIDVLNSKIEGDNAKLGSCLSIESPNATVTGGEILNCGKGIVSTASDSTIDAVIIHDVNSCIELAGSSAKIKGGEISKCADGIKISAPDVQIDSTMVHDTTTCVELVGDRAHIKSLEASKCSQDAIKIIGEDALIEASTIVSATTCIELQGNNGKVKGGEISKCVDGIKISGVDALIDSAIIHDASTCVNISGDRGKVRASEISKCSDGIRIAASDTLLGADDTVIYESEAARNKVYEAEKNKIHDNVTGIHVVSGDRNRFAFNDVDKNAESNKDPTADNGILMEAGANGGIARPRVIFPQEGSKNALRCKADKDGNILERSIHFAVPGKGKIVLFTSSDYKQATSLFSICDVDAYGICKIENVISDQKFSSNMCGRSDMIITALFSGTSSTSYLLDPFIPYGIASLVVPVEAIPGEMPGVQGDGQESGDANEQSSQDLGSSDRIALGNQQEPPSVGNAEEDDKVSSGTTSSAMSGDAGGALASPAMAMKCSLDPTNASPSILDLAFALIAFSLTLSLITRMRFRARRSSKVS